MSPLKKEIESGRKLAGSELVTFGTKINENSRIFGGQKNKD